MTVHTYPKNKNIKIQLNNINPGAPTLTIVTYEWKINNIIQSNNINNIIINTNNLNLGSNEISWRIQNSCDSWSNTITITLNIILDTTSTNIIYTKNKNLTLKAININPGAPNLTIKNYEWKINNSQISNNTDTLNINTNNLLIGINIITLRLQNSCDSWSDTLSYSIEVYKTKQKTFTIDVNQPTINITMGI